MKNGCCFVLVLLLGVAMASRLSLAAAGDSNSSSIPAIVGREVRGFVAKAGDMLSSAGWRAARSSAGVAEAKNLRAAAAARRRSRKSGRSASCVTAAMCRKRRVICVKRCFGASRASLSYASSRCIVKCKKCVPTC